MSKVNLESAYDEAFRAAVSIEHLQVFIADENLSETDVGRVCHVLENLWCHSKRLQRCIDDEALLLQCRKTRTSATTLNGRTAPTWIELAEVIAREVLTNVFGAMFLFENSTRQTIEVDLALLQKEWPNICKRLAERPIDSDKLAAELQVEGVHLLTDTAVAEFLGNGKYRIGDQIISLEFGETANALQALVELQSATSKDLARESGSHDPGKCLRKIVAKHPLLRPFVTLPGKRGTGGYSTRIVDGRT